MKPVSRKKIRSGFSLVEVVLALAVVAIAIPTIIGLMGVLSTITDSTIDDGETASAVNSLQLFLNGKVTDPATDETVPFDTVYGWVYAASQDPANAQVVYAYKADADETEYTVSQDQPADVTEGKVLAAEILGPETSLLPAADLVSDVSAYTKSYLPLELSVYGLSVGWEARAPETFVGSYPLVISR